MSGQGGGGAGGEATAGSEAFMDNDRQVMRAAVELAESGEEFVLVTVTKSKGSTPRNAGARMIVRASAARADGLGGVPGAPDTGGAIGTIGGGQLEHLVLDAARVCLEKKTSRVEEFVLGADADQCCGGVMEVFLEYFGARARLVVFGAGHVAYELAALLEDSAVELVVVDDRAEWNSEDRFGRRGYAGAAEGTRLPKRVLSWRDGVNLARQQAETTMSLVMTCSHDTDFELLRQLLSRDGSGATPYFVGLIGSRSKRACLFGRLVASGLDETRVQSVKCPIGVGDTGKTPRAVAISIAAQVLMEARRLADVARERK